MSQLTKEQIDAVAEWMTTSRWGIYGLQNSVIIKEIRNKHSLL